MVLSDLRFSSKICDNLPLDQVRNVAFTAPEHLPDDRGQPSLVAFTPAADIFALGVFIFLILTGYLPFQGNTGEGSLLHIHIAITSIHPRHHASQHNVCRLKW